MHIQENVVKDIVQDDLQDVNISGKGSVKTVAHNVVQSHDASSSQVEG